MVTCRMNKDHDFMKTEAFPEIYELNVCIVTNKRLKKYILINLFLFKCILFRKLICLFCFRLFQIVYTESSSKVAFKNAENVNHDCQKS